MINFEDLEVIGGEDLQEQVDNSGVKLKERIQMTHRTVYQFCDKCKEETIFNRLSKSVQCTECGYEYKYKVTV